MRLYDQSCRTLICRSVSQPARRPWRFVPGLCSLLVLPTFLALVASCASPATHSKQSQDPPTSGFRIESSAFSEGEMIPERYTCTGEDVSPPLRWTQPPRGTQSFALIVEDPDAPAGVWTHWVVYNLPASEREMPENVSKQERIPDGGLQGLNSFGHAGYGGPCPPPGKAHRYFFRLYALDTMLNLNPGASKEDVLEATKGHIVAESQLMGRFGR